FRAAAGLGAQERFELDRRPAIAQSHAVRQGDQRGRERRVQIHEAHSLVEFQSFPLDEQPLLHVPEQRHVSVWHGGSTQRGRKRLHRHGYCLRHEIRVEIGPRRKKLISSAPHGRGAPQRAKYSTANAMALLKPWAIIPGNTLPVRWYRKARNSPTTK